MKTKLFAALFTLSLSSTVALAHPAAVIPSENLPKTLAASLEQDISVARLSNPGGFAAVEGLRAKVPELDRKKRGGLLPVSPALKPLGRDALLPLLEQLSFVAQPDGFTPSAKKAWTIGVVEAVGMLRDPRGADVLASLLDGRADREVLAAAAEGLARFGDDKAAAKLVALSNDPEKSHVILAAMGDCRRLIVAERLAAALQTAEAFDARKALVRSLGEVGNAWAWQTPAVSAKAEEGAVRLVAAKALVAAFVRHDDLRTEVGNALLLVDHPSTAKLIEDARASAPDEGAAFDALSARMAQSPVR